MMRSDAIEALDLADVALEKIVEVLEAEQSGRTVEDLATRLLDARDAVSDIASVARRLFALSADVRRAFRYASIATTQLLEILEQMARGDTFSTDVDDVNNIARRIERTLGARADVAALRQRLEVGK